MSLTKVYIPDMVTGDLPFTRISDAPVISPLEYGAVGDGTTDDTVALQAAITANPSYATIDGLNKTYKITAALKIPDGSRYLTIQDLNLSVTGDIVAIQSNAATDLISFFSLRKSLISCSGHSTVGRRAFDFSCFSQSSFIDVWVNGVSGKTIAFYGTGTNGGSAPYYNVFDHCYIGNISIGISFDDAAAVINTSNSNTVSNCRIQPGSGNFGVYIGNNNQNIRVQDCEFESAGGTGVYCAGYACSFIGNRFESMTYGISFNSAATACFEAGNYFDSNTTNRNATGDAVYNNNYINDKTATSGVTNALYGQTIFYPTGNQPGSSVFSRSIGTNYSNYTSDSDAAASTSWRHFQGTYSTGSAASIVIYGNGNVVNANNSYGAISDATMKENIVDATPKLEDLLKVQVRNFNLKDDPEATKQIGVIAQELEQVFPAMVETDTDGTKNVKYSVFVPMLIKAIQELSAKVDALENK